MPPLVLLLCIGLKYSMWMTHHFRIVDLICLIIEGDLGLFCYWAIRIGIALENKG